MLHQNILKGCIYAFAAIHAYAFIIFVYNMSLVVVIAKLSSSTC